LAEKGWFARVETDAVQGVKWGLIRAKPSTRQQKGRGTSFVGVLTFFFFPRKMVGGGDWVLCLQVVFLTGGTGGGEVLKQRGKGKRTRWTRKREKKLGGGQARNKETPPPPGKERKNN